VKLDIRGIGWVTPYGMGSGRPGEVCTLGPGRLPSLKSRHFLETPHPRFGRFDTYAKAGFGAIALALKSAQLDRWTAKRDVGLVVSTCRGCLEADLAYFETAAFDKGTLASPNIFAYTLPSCMLGEASIQFGLTGPSFVTDDSDDHLAGIYAAVDLMRWGLCRTLVAGWCDVNSKLLPPGADEPVGAVFVVLTEGSAESVWQWDRGRLMHGAQSVVDLAQLTRMVVERAGDAR
jgi:3-oxoacyl-[acyl-carrier-protein] synthase II